MLPLNLVNQQTKFSLKDKWPQAIGIGAILLATLSGHYLFFEITYMLLANLMDILYAFILSAVTTVIIAQFFFFPLLYGALRWFWHSSNPDNPPIPISEIFCYISGSKLYLQALSLSFRIFFRTASIMFVCFIPSIIIMVLRYESTYELLNYQMPYWVESFWILGNFLNLFGLIASFLLMLRYFVAPILIIDDASTSPKEAMRLSALISKGIRANILSFIFAFLPLALLSFLVLPLLVTLPYFLCAYAIYSRSIIRGYIQHTKQINQNFF